MSTADGAPYIVGALALGERVSCLYCGRHGFDYGRGNDYGRGEAVLAGPDHPPYDANANYVCIEHIMFPEGVQIDVVDYQTERPYPHVVIMTIEEYAALAGG